MTLLLGLWVRVHTFELCTVDPTTAHGSDSVDKSTSPSRLLFEITLTEVGEIVTESAAERRSSGSWWMHILWLRILWSVIITVINICQALVVLPKGKLDAKNFRDRNTTPTPRKK